MADQKRILILTADAGFGHRSAANAVAAALEEMGEDRYQIDVVNPLEDKRAPFFLRDVGSDYDKIIRNVPELYRFGYDASDATVPAALIESAMVVLLFEIMRDVVRQYKPDAILSTYPLYQSPLTAVFAIGRMYIPLLTVVTDLVTVHRIWFHKNVDACLVATDQVAELARQSGLATDKVIVTGLPVHPDIIRETRTPEQVRADLGWRADMVTLLAVGSRRVENLISALRVVNHFGAPLQLAVVAGKDEELYHELVSMEWHLPAVHLYEFSKDIPSMMHASDAVICKAGGLIVTESLACGKPMMLIDVIPGQETGNADYVIQGGAADMAMTPLEVLEVLSHWIQNDGALLTERAANAARLGQPEAAYRTANLVMAAAQRGPVSRRRRKIEGRTTLVDLLNKNHVRWEDNFRAQALSTEETHAAGDTHLR
jgi:1,2-diacylglycerol 3-beta-galactosyltransferase